MKRRRRAAKSSEEDKIKDRPSRKLNKDLEKNPGSISDRVMFLQRTIGNQAVEGLIRSGALQRKELDQSEKHTPERPQEESKRPPATQQHPIPDHKKTPEMGSYKNLPYSHRHESYREKIAKALRKAGIPSWAVPGLVVLIIAALADPEPFSKVALLIGTAAAVVFFMLMGQESDIPPAATSTARVNIDNSKDDSKKV